MTERKALLVGSLPFANEKEAMHRALAELGESLICLPDGEIGEKTEQYPLGSRSAWAMVSIDLCLADSKRWEIIKEGRYGESGFPVDYDALYKVRPKCEPNDLVQHLNFHYHDYFNESYPIFKQLRKEHGTPDMKFQVGIPTGLAISLHMLEPENIFRYFDAFNERLAFEMNEIIKQAGDDVVIQLEIPAEVGVVYQSPDQIDVALQSVFGLVKRLDPSAKVGVHLCYGDLNNESITHPTSLKTMADFVNKMIQEWPQAHDPLYIHFPFAEGDIPPRLEASYYEPLKHIQLPASTRFVAGFVHEKREMAELQQILQTIETIRNHPIDIACSCGLGRRSPEVAIELLNKMEQLVDS